MILHRDGAWSCSFQFPKSVLGALQCSDLISSLELSSIYQSSHDTFAWAAVWGRMSLSLPRLVAVAVSVHSHGPRSVHTQQPASEWMKEKPSLNLGLASHLLAHPLPSEAHDPAWPHPRRLGKTLGIHVLGLCTSLPGQGWSFSTPPHPRRLVKA